jgi:uncharacterized protein
MELMMSSEVIRELVIAAHGDLEKVKELAGAHPDLLDSAHEWRPNMTESPLEAAAHTGRREIAEFLLGKGAKPIIVAAAMLGDKESFEQLLVEDPERIRELGAHNFTLIFHAGLGGNLAIAERIYNEVGDEGINSALLASVMTGQQEMTKWLIAKGVSLDSTDFRGRTPLQVAVESDDSEMMAILRDAIGEENLEACESCGEKGYKYLAEIEGNAMGAHTKTFKCKKCEQEMEVVQVG